MTVLWLKPLLRSPASPVGMPGSKCCLHFSSAFLLMQLRGNRVWHSCLDLCHKHGKSNRSSQFPPIALCRHVRNDLVERRSLSFSVPPATLSLFQVSKHKKKREKKDRKRRERERNKERIGNVKKSVTETCWAIAWTYLSQGLPIRFILWCVIAAWCSLLGWLSCILLGL